MQVIHANVAQPSPFKKARYLAKNFTIHQKPHVVPTLKDKSMHVLVYCSFFNL